MAQSTNDVYPTAVKLALHWAGIHGLLEAMAVLRHAFAAKADEFARRAEDGPHPAAGRRAHDARPGVLGLRGHASAKTSTACAEALPLIEEMNLGAHRHRHAASTPPPGYCEPGVSST